ncbi:MAG TPA: glycosyltransferase [Fimbriiglobus sp.]|jgi:glycosyltransferase involved in cell wall biosynthesis
MLLTVAICTWNRAKLLDQTLGKMRSLVLPAGVSWELLLVDNNCTDDTPAVVANYESTLPIRRIVELKQGHSHARNCAIDHARGDYLIWTDDDVLVEPGWLSEYVSAFRRWPGAGYFGGKIDPWFESDPPAWVTDNLEHLQGMLVIRDLGTDERKFVEAEQPFGANMAFPLAVQKRFRYDPALGKVKAGNILADETELFRRMRGIGLAGVWVPTAAVKHFVTQSRLTREFAKDYFEGIGRTLVKLDGVPTGATVRGAPRWLVGKYLKARAAAAMNRAAGGTAWVLPFTRSAYYAGMIRECRTPGAVPCG